MALNLALKSFTLFSILFFSCIAQNYNPGPKFNEKLQYSRMGLYFAPAINLIQTNSDAETKSNIGIVYGYALEMSLNENHYLESGFSILIRAVELPKRYLKKSLMTMAQALLI